MNIDNRLIKKLQSEINFSDDLNESEINYTETELKEIEIQKVNQIKIQLVNKYLNGDQSSLNLDNNSSGGSNPNQTQNDNEKQSDESENESEQTKTQTQTDQQSENESDESESGSENENENENESDESESGSASEQTENELSENESDESESGSASDESESDESESGSASDESESDESESDESESGSDSEQTQKEKQEEQTDEQKQKEDESNNQSVQIQMPENDLTDQQYENELRTISKQMLKNAYNIIEDERIESNTGKNQRGSFVRFNQKNKECGKINFNHVDDIADPNSALLAVRQFKNDLVKQTKYSKCEKYIIESRLKDNQAGLILIVDYWNEQLKPYLKDLKKNIAIKKSLKNKTDLKTIKEKFRTTIINESWDQFDIMDRDYSNDVISTISSITEKQIHLTTKHLDESESGSAFVYYQKRNKTFEIVIPENDKLINYKTELEHEYSHVLHKTSFKYFFELMDQLVDKFIIELKQNGDLKN